MSIHIKQFCFFLIVRLQYCKSFAFSHASDPYSRPIRFFEFELAPSPNQKPPETPFTPSPAPNPPLQPPLIDPQPPQSPPQSPPQAFPSPLPQPPLQSSPFLAASGGIKGAQKAGIIVGSVAGVALLVAAGAGIVYKKRRSNAMRRQLEMAAMQPVFQVASGGSATT